MQSFKFKFPLSVLILTLVVCITSLAGAILNTINLIKNINNLNSLFLQKASNVFFMVICLAVAVYAFLVFVNSKYVIKNGYLVLRLGIFSSKTNINNITAIANFNQDKKLVVYTNNGAYSVIVISESLYDDFIAGIKKINTQISVSFEK